MDIRKVKKLIELLEESDINEIEIKEGEESVRISRASSVMVAAAPVMQAAPAPVAAPVLRQPLLLSHRQHQRSTATLSLHPWLAPSTVPLPQALHHLCRLASQ
jgi:biotin carboxyl carrier protein